MTKHKRTKARRRARRHDKQHAPPRAISDLHDEIMQRELNRRYPITVEDMLRIATLGKSTFMSDTTTSERIYVSNMRYVVNDAGEVVGMVPENEHSG